MLQSLCCRSEMKLYRVQPKNRHHETLRHWPCERGSCATDVRVSRQPDLVRADDGTPAPCPLARPCATISAGCFTAAALLHPTIDAFADLQRLVSPGEHVALFTASPLDVAGDWQVERSRWIDQMICEASLGPPPVAPLPLGTTDVPEMLELTAATEPGPFLPQTIQMGSYFGIRASDGRLVAMAGERLQSTAFVEISAVCTRSEEHTSELQSLRHLVCR